MTVDVHERFAVAFPDTIQLERLPLLSKVLNDSSRLTPLVALMAHQVANKCIMDGEICQPGDDVLVSVPAFHKKAYQLG